MSDPGSETGLIDDFVADIVVCLNFVVLANLVVLVGLVTNLINLIVFKTYGFKESTTVTLFSLAVSDLISLILYIPYSVIYIPNFPHFSQASATFYSYKQVFGQTKNLARLISVWITVLITVERCVCIIAPLKVKTIFTPRRSAVAILVFSLGLSIPLLTSVGLFFKEGGANLNMASRSDSIRSTNKANSTAKPRPTNVYQSVVFGLSATCNLISLLAVVASTICLTIMLWRNSEIDRGISEPQASTRMKGNGRRWNLKLFKASAKVHPISVLPNPNALETHLTASTSNPTASTSHHVQASGSSATDNTYISRHTSPSGPHNSTSDIDTEIHEQARNAHAQDGSVGAIASLAKKRARKLARMVLVLSLIQLAYFIPAAVILTTGFFEPEFRVGRRYENTFLVAYSCINVLDAVIASTNLFIYYRMSSRYKNALDRLLRFNRPNMELFHR